MSKIAEYLRSHISGEVTSTVDARTSFANGGSLVSMYPQAVVYPRGEQDIRKVARFSWQLAEKGKVIPIVARGVGSDWTGGSVGDGIVLATTSHLNKILELDTRKGDMLVEVGAVVGKVQQALVTHGNFLPFEPISTDFATIGGCFLTKSSGIRDGKYGSIADSISIVRVVLANGELISTGRISKREVSKRMGQSTFEGEIYRSLDALLAENKDIIDAYTGPIVSAGYNIFEVRTKDGSIDLTPLFAGSQGTLGIVSSVRLKTTAYNPLLSQVAVAFMSHDELMMSADAIIKLSPSVFTVIDKSALEVFSKEQPMYFQQRFGTKIPEALVLLEWDEFNVRSQKRSVKKLKKVLSKLDVKIIEMSDEKSREEHSKFFRIPSILLQTEIDQNRAVPGFESVFMPRSNMKDFVAAAKDMFNTQKTEAVFWWDYSLQEVRCFPYVDIRKLGDRQKVIKLMDMYHKLVLNNGGAVSFSGGGGRSSALYAKDMYGDVLFGVMEKIKKIFDPYNILNPGVKVDVDKRILTNKMQQEQSLGFYNMFIYK